MKTLINTPIIDFHAHFPVKHDVYLDSWESRYEQKFGPEKMQILRTRSGLLKHRWLDAYQIPVPEQPVPENDIQAQRWFKECQRYNLEKIVFVTGGGNEQLSEIIKLYPDRFIGFAHHEPFTDHALEKLTLAVQDLGLRGYKILAPAIDRRLDDPTLEPLWKFLEKHRLPVLIHFGILGGGGGIGNGVNINPIIIHDVAKGFPEIPFIIPHFGCGYTRELLQIAWACPNIYADTSGTNDWMRWMPFPITLQGLFRVFVETLGPKRVIFGTDSNHFPRGFAYHNYQVQWQACRDIGLDDHAMNAIFHDNAARIFSEIRLGKHVV